MANAEASLLGYLGSAKGQGTEKATLLSTPTGFRSPSAGRIRAGVTANLPRGPRAIGLRATPFGEPGMREKGDGRGGPPSSGTPDAAA